VSTHKATLSWCHGEIDYRVDVEGHPGYEARGWDPGDPGEMDVIRVYLDVKGPKVERPELEPLAQADDTLWDAFQEECCADPDEPPDWRDDR
jgi:hypothetical protein